MGCKKLNPIKKKSNYNMKKYAKRPHRASVKFIVPVYCIKFVLDFGEAPQ